MTLANLVKKVSSAMLIPVMAVAVDVTPVQADHNAVYASYVRKSARTSNPQGILYGPETPNGAAKIDGPKPFVGREGYIDVGFHQPVFNGYGPDLMVNATNSGVYEVYARDPRTFQWYPLGQGQGCSAFDIGYLPFATEFRIRNITVMKNIFVDWSMNLHPYPSYPMDD
ncbi:hypothetical protein HY639_03835 [Candidatus Woesearchaeota archaeon]|nr:hypothetical protein [Candidatus Woesearchaeota archaeon]